MPIFRDGRLMADEDWRLLGADEPVPVAGRVVLPLDRWRREQPAAVDGLALGVRIAPADAVDPRADRLSRAELAVIVFERFTDGRGYSIARQLRESGFAGEMRATGEVLLDQVPLMLRAGFDSLEIVDPPTLAALVRGHLPAVSEVYQARRRGEHGMWRYRFVGSAATLPPAG